MKGEKLQGNHLPERKFAPKAQEVLINLGPWADTLRQVCKTFFFLAYFRILKDEALGSGGWQWS